MPDDFKLRLKELADLLPKFEQEAARGEINSGTIAELRAGWGNPYTPQPEFITEACRFALRAGTGILECGSGLTSVLMAVLGSARKIPVVTLEHDPTWVEIARKAFAYLEVPFASIFLAELKSYGDFDWYDVEGLALPPGFDFVLCDGPPGTTRGGRYGLLPVMQQRLSSGNVILLDDADRPGESDTLRLWSERYSHKFELRGTVPHRFALVGG